MTCLADKIEIVSNQYISGNTTSITIESDDYLYLNADVSTMHLVTH